MPAPWPLKFGAFYAPFHPVGQSPTLALEYDLERVEAARPLRLRRGLVRRAPLRRLRDHRLPRDLHRRRGRSGPSTSSSAPAWCRCPTTTRGWWPTASCCSTTSPAGRLIFGAGPGALPTDAYMMGIDPVDQRRMMEESPRGDPRPVHERRAGRPARPTGSRSARRGCRCARTRTRTPRSRWPPWCRRRARAWPAQHDVSLLSLSMSVAEGFAAIGQAWGVVEEQAAKRGQPEPDRDTWRVLGNLHIAETREQAVAGLHLRAQGLRRLLRRRRRLRAAGQQGRRRAGHARGVRRALQRRPAVSSSAPPTTPSSTSRACSSSRAASARS